jgi:hypothetical protein
MRMLYAEYWLVSAGKCGTRDTTHTIPALLEIVLYAFGNANVESVSESIDLIAADLTPFEQHLKPHHDQHMSRARQDVLKMFVPLPDCIRSSLRCRTIKSLAATGRLSLTSAMLLQTLSLKDSDPAE